ncbi:hypothetical protein D3C79_1071540 [compost metagenome]
MSYRYIRAFAGSQCCTELGIILTRFQPQRFDLNLLLRAVKTVYDLIDKIAFPAPK